MMGGGVWRGDGPSCGTRYCREERAARAVVVGRLRSSAIAVPCSSEVEVRRPHPSVAVQAAVVASLG